MGAEFPPFHCFSTEWLEEKGKVVTVLFVSETNRIPLSFALWYTFKLIPIQKL